MSFIRRQVGLRTDSAAPDGSLHAKIVEMRAYLGGEVLKVQRSRSLKRIEWRVDSKELTNVLYVTGKGELLALAHVNPNPDGDHGIYRIVLDGIEIFYGSTGEGGTALAISYSAILWGSHWGELGTIGGLNLPFSSSLLIQCARGGANLARGVALYSLE